MGKPLPALTVHTIDGQSIGDHVRHLVPESGPAKVRIIRAAAAEAAKILAAAKGVKSEPVTEAAALEP